MKKSYETPSVEKIKFNYRDQVVAASGTLNSSGTEQGGRENTTIGEQVKDYLFQGLGWSGCDAYECTSLANLG